MAELSDKGRKLIDAAMEHDEPPGVDDSWGTLVSRLTAEAPRGMADVPEPATQQRGRADARPWIWIVASVAAAVAIGVVWQLSTETPKPATTPSAKIEPKPITMAPPKLTRPAELVPVEPPTDQLLVDAEAALKAGDPDRAMTMLQRHAERAATDPRAPQRMALRVLVLCAQGNREQASSEAKAFLAVHGQTQWGDAVRRSCIAP